MTLFRDVREREFPWTRDTVYLNNASIGPLPARTRRVTEQFAERRSRPHTLGDADLVGILHGARSAAAGLIGADPAEIALTTNTSFGLNTAALGLPIEPGQIVVLPDREFPANVYPWLRLEERGVRVERIPPTPEGWPDEERLLERIAAPDVRLVAVSHVQFHNGYRVDLARLGHACRAHGAFLVVDAIQSLGQLPLDVSRVPVDIVACGGQKWLLSPWGSGFLYVRRDLLDVLEPAMSGWMAFEGTDDFSRLTEYDRTWRGDARRYELVTLPFQDFAGFTESVALLLECGLDRVAEHLERLRRPVLEAGERGALELLSPPDTRGSAIMSVRVDEAARAYARLRDAGVTCAFREGAIRLSPHCYNTEDEMERVVSLLENG
jgi:cysteine desulfurase/selenocysteine lyase